MKNINYKKRPDKMKSFSSVDKAGNLKIESVKIYGGSVADRTDSVLIPKKELEAAKKLKQGDISGFKSMFYKYLYNEIEGTKKPGLRVVSESVKQCLATHPRELSHGLRHITKAIDRPDLCKQAGDYGKKGGDKVKAVKKAKAGIKAKVKKAKVKVKKTSKVKS